MLCEKPFTANAAEAESVIAAHRAGAARGQVVVMAGFHCRYHPLVARLLEIIGSGELGDISHIETTMNVPLLRKGDIRYGLALAGGAGMDVGYYVLHILRTLAGAEPEAVSTRRKPRTLAR
ncbi:MAG: Gfo/Idh/MocA family protein [Acidimicrobiales bacterium]